MKILALVSRIIVGLTFIFSGFVKAIDPLGLTYKISEYFEIYHMGWIIPAALGIAIFLCMLEFTIGVALLFNIKLRIFGWLALITMFGFLVLTFLSALFNWVTDCGCFGDAVKLTNWETFYKNVVLMVFTLVVFFYRKKNKDIYTTKGASIFIGVAAGLLVFVSIYCYRHLPLIDFLPWKVGAKIADQVVPTPEVSDIFLIYKNKKTGQTKEYTQNEFMKSTDWKDSTWLANWEFSEQKKKVVQEFKDAPIHDFVIEDIKSNDYTDKFINNKNYNFILVAHLLEKTDASAYPAINKFQQQCEKDSINFIGLTASDFSKMDYFRHDVQAMFDFYSVDETALKTMIRANPGILLLKNGVVIAKWNHRDLPQYSEVKEKYMKNL